MTPNTHVTPRIGIRTAIAFTHTLKLSRFLELFQKFHEMTAVKGLICYRYVCVCTRANISRNSVGAQYIDLGVPSTSGRVSVQIYCGAFEKIDLNLEVFI